MKKQLLTIAVMALASLSFGQFTFTSNSISYTGNAIPAGNTQGQFYSNQPDNFNAATQAPGPLFADNTCSTPIVQGSGPNDVGGFDPSVHSTANGATFYGGKLRTVYYGTPCTAQIPSFGFNTGKDATNGGIGAGVNIDLSATANQKITFTYTSDATIDLTLQLFDGAFNEKLNNGTIVHLVANSTNTPPATTLTVDFSGDIATNAVLTDVRQVSFLYNSNTLSPNFGISLTNILLNGPVGTGVNAAQSNIAGTKVYPNPASGLVNVQLDLISTSNVKVVLNDLYGKEMKVVAEGTYSNMNESFNVSDLAKGMYTLTYILNNTPAKTELLMIK